MKYELLISRRSNGEIITIKTYPGNWGNKECEPLFFKTVVDLSLNQVKKLYNSCVYDFISNTFVYEDTKEPFIAENILETSDISDTILTNTAENLVDSDFNNGEKIKDQCTFLSPKNIKEAEDKDEVMKEMRILALKLLYPYRNQKGMLEILNDIKYGTFSVIYYRLKNLSQEIKEKEFTIEKIGTTYYNWLKQEIKVL